MERPRVPAKWYVTTLASRAWFGEEHSSFTVHVLKTRKPPLPKGYYDRHEWWPRHHRLGKVSSHLHAQHFICNCHLLRLLSFRRFYSSQYAYVTWEAMHDQFDKNMYVWRFESIHVSVIKIDENFSFFFLHMQMGKCSRWDHAKWRFEVF